MTRIASAIATIKKKTASRIFNLAAKDAMKLGRIDSQATHDFTLLTMLCRRDILQYLLAVNSFCQYIVPARFVIIDDGSLRDVDKQLLKERLDRCEIWPGKAFLDDRLPLYSSWQRIQALAELAKTSYVVQMDADIIFAQDIPEVRNALEDKKPFLLGTDEGETLVGAVEAQEFARQFYDEGERHVQCLCEVNLDALAGFPELRYVRACAGFSGYPAHSFRKSQLLGISASFTQRIGSDWPVWGSEQVASNILLSNMPESTVLPLEYYDSVERYSQHLKMIHFIGNCRFDNGTYSRVARDFLRNKNS